MVQQGNEPSDGNSRSIGSDEHLFDLIESLRDQQVAGVTDLAEETGLAKSTVHGHLTALRDRGYVVRTDRGYRLGLEFLNHGKQVQYSYQVFPLAEDKTAQLAAETGEIAWCIVEENGMGYYLTGAEGEHSVKTLAQIGDRDALHPLAGGKAILAHLPTSRVHEIIERHGLTKRTDNTTTDAEALIDELEVVRERGYALNDGESLPGLYAIGAPILDQNGVAEGALSIAGPKNRLDNDETRDDLIDLLLGATNELEINLQDYRSM